MEVKVLREEGYEEAALGFSLSYNSTPERGKELFKTKAFIQGGENKFLESIYVWLDVSAPRFWWSEADTYRISTKQSESTMHTIIKRPLTIEDFESSEYNEEHFKIVLNYLNSIRLENKPNVEKVRLMKEVLPESFIQKRIWVMSYKTLQNIVHQRKNHALPQWRQFISQIQMRLEHPEFIFPIDKK